MGEDLAGLGEDFKPELFGLLLGSLADIEFDRARDLVEIADLEFLDDAVGVLAREQGPEHEAFLLHAKDVAIDHGRHGLIGGAQDNLFLENRVVIIGDDARDAAFSDKLVLDSLILIIRVPALDIDSNLLFIEFL